MKILTAPSANTDVPNKQFVDQSAAGRPTYSYAAPLAGLKNQYDPLRGVYNYKSSNTRNLDQGISNAMAGGQAEWLWIGDSGSAGTNSTLGLAVVDRLKAVPLTCRDTLGVMGVPVSGSGFIRVTDNGAGDPRVVTTGTWSSTQATLLSTVVGSTLTITMDRSADQLDVWYFQQAASGTFTVSINGATSGVGFATVNTVGTPNTWKRLRMPGVAIDKGSTVKITLTVAGTGVYFAGVVGFVRAGGLIMHNVSQIGAQAGGSATAAKNWSDVSSAGLGSVFLALGWAWRQVTDASFTAASNVLTSATAAFTAEDKGRAVDTLTPTGSTRAVPGQAYIVDVTDSTHAVMSAAAVVTVSSQTVNIGKPPGVLSIELGLNDLANGRTVAQVIADITTIRGQYPSSAQGTDCILHLYGEMSYSFISQALQQQFWQAIYDLADTLDCVLYDWRDRVGTYVQGQALGSYGDNYAHLTAATYSDIGASLAMIIGGGRGLPQHADVPARPEDLTNKRYVDSKIRSGGLLTQSITSNVETIVAQVFIPANTLAVGSQIVYDFVTKPTIAGVTNARLRVGQAGTVAGDSAFAVAGTGISSTNTQLLHGVMTVLAIGSSGTINGTGTFAGGTAVNTPTGAPSTVAIDTTKDNYLSLTAFVAASALTNYAAKMEVNV